MSVFLDTSLGDIVIDLYTEKCPLATKNFLKLCKIKYYNNCVFHTVQKDFIIQTGDPTGTGSGGDSIYKYLYGDQARFFSDEIHPDLKHDKIGVVAMASAGENLNASQFYITTRGDLDYLDGKHTIFGVVAEGEEVLMRINEAFVDEKYRPLKNIRIKHTHILEDPFDDPVQLAELIPDRSPELKPPAEGEEVRLEDDWVPMDERLDPEELEKSLREKEAYSRAVVLEMVGDIPEAEIKPPENVLFVCKLNPVTQEDDLEIIFSRFGKVISADIIRDYKTGDSLCYAFIEFETQEACEAAYFKMDNVLIDDRRIHVDFSQSVAKLWTRYRRFGKKDKGDGEGGTSFAPQVKGQGCFKCGETGHIARDCPNNGQTEILQEKPKYELKDTGGQHGGTGKRYDMVFDHASREAKKDGRKRHHEENGHSKEGRSHSPIASRQSTKDSHRREHGREEKHVYHADSREKGNRIDEKHSDLDDKRSYNRNDRYSRSNETRHNRETSPDYKHRDKYDSDRRQGRDRDFHYSHYRQNRDRDNRHSDRDVEREIRQDRKSRHDTSPDSHRIRIDRSGNRDRKHNKDRDHKKQRADESD